MEGLMGGLPVMPDQSHPSQQLQPQQQPPLQPQAQPPPQKVVEKLNPGVVQQLNLDSVKTRAVGLYKTITRILEEFGAMAHNDMVPKWQDVLGQFSMVNLELYNIVEDIKKTSRAFVVYPKNVNAENSTILPVMLSSKLLPEMEADDNSKREQLLLGMQNLPVVSQIEKLKARIDMITAACESAEKVLADRRKAYGLDTRQRMITLPTMDKAMAAKIQEQENLLRSAVNRGEGLRLPADQRQLTSSIPAHLAEALAVDAGQPFTPDTSGMYAKNTPPISSGNISNQGTPVQVSGAQLHGRSAPSPSGGAQPSFDNPSPLQYGNSPRSGVNMMNAPSPQQQAQQHHQQQLQQQQLQRQKLLQQLPPHQQQQLLAQQQLRQSSMAGAGAGAGPNPMQQLSDLQNQQKFQALQGQQMQYSQPSSTQQFQGRQLPTGHLQHNIGQSQLGQASQLNRHMGQFSGPANSALFNAAQNVTNTSMVANMQTSQQLHPRMQYALTGANPQQRTHASQIISDQMFNMAGGNPSNMMAMQQQQSQQQQHASQGAFGNMPQNTQNLQPNMVQQNHPNFQQQRQQNPQ